MDLAIRLFPRSQRLFSNADGTMCDASKYPGAPEGVSFASLVALLVERKRMQATLASFLTDHWFQYQTLLFTADLERHRHCAGRADAPGDGVAEISAAEAVAGFRLEEGGGGPIGKMPKLAIASEEAGRGVAAFCERMQSEYTRALEDLLGEAACAGLPDCAGTVVALAEGVGRGEDSGAWVRAVVQSSTIK